jgi:Ni/Fe-hydrogenase 1 B-type cytochrome subunit
MPDTREVDTDIKNFLPQKANRHQLWPWVKYYLFLKKDHPISGKYGSLQKIAYVATPFLILAAAYSGFCLWGPTSQFGIFRAGTVWVAGLYNAGGGGDPMPMRILHYYIMWVILMFTAIHAYLANIYNFGPSKMIFAWKEN